MIRTHCSLGERTYSGELRYRLRLATGGLGAAQLEQHTDSSSMVLSIDLKKADLVRERELIRLLCSSIGSAAITASISEYCCISVPDQIEPFARKCFVALLHLPVVLR